MLKPKYDKFVTEFNSYINPAEYSNSEVLEFWKSKMEDIKESDLIDSDSNDPMHRSLELLCSYMQNEHQREGVSWDNVAYFSSIGYILKEYYGWRYQFANTFNIRRLNSFKWSIQNSINYYNQRLNINAEKFNSNTLNSNEMRDYVENFFHIEYGVGQLLDVVDARIAELQQREYNSSHWVDASDLKITYQNDTSKVKIEFKDPELKDKFKAGNYMDDKSKLQGFALNLKDFEKEDGTYEAIIEMYDTGFASMEIPAELKYIPENNTDVGIKKVARHNGDIELVMYKAGFNAYHNETYLYTAGGQHMFDAEWKATFGDGILVMKNDGGEKPWRYPIAQYWYDVQNGVNVSITEWKESKIPQPGIGDEEFFGLRFYRRYKHSYNNSSDKGVRNIYAPNGYNSIVREGGKEVYAINSYHRLKDTFTTRTSVGTMTDELSGDVYIKMDEDGVNVRYYTFDGENYHIHNGFLYVEPNNTALETERLWQNRYYSYYYYVVDGYKMDNSYQLSAQFGLNMFQGWKDCDGLERTKTVNFNSNYFNNGWYTQELHPAFKDKGWTLELENKEGESLSVNLDNYTSIQDSRARYETKGETMSLHEKLRNYLSNGSMSYANYIAEYDLDFENKILKITQATSGLPVVLGQFAGTDANDIYMYGQNVTVCDDTDGDGVYNQIDGWPNDPAYAYDFDGDGIPDEEDEFPWDAEPTYSVLKDLISGEDVLIPTDITKRMSYINESNLLTYVDYSGGKSGVVVKGLEFKGIASTNEEGYTVLPFSADVSIYSHEDYSTEQFVIDRVNEMIAKYNEKGKGKK